MIVAMAKEAYSVTALQKAAYSTAAEFRISIADDGANYKVTVEHVKEGSPDGGIESFLQAASDYALREKLGAQTEMLRNLILAHAYSQTSFIKE